MESVISILILGAHGQIARVATDLFLERTGARLTIYLRQARRLTDQKTPQEYFGIVP